MKTTFTKNYMLGNRECYTKQKVTDLFFTKGESEITIDGVLKANIPLKDKYWFIIKKTDLTVAEKQQIAIGVASVVLEIFENEYPEDDRPRKAIEAAKEYLAGNIDRDELNAAAASYMKSLESYLVNFVKGLI